jgi:hypothetical protein
MHKLRHIHSKVGSETAFRIPVSVEDAIAEAVEAYDEMSARCIELKALAYKLRARVSVDDEFFEPSLEIITRLPAASLLLHDAQVIRDVADMLTFHNIDDCSYYKGYDHAISDVRAAADALEGEGGG